jgi:hypothetical protein
MPPRHRKGIADAENPPEPDDSRKQIAEKDLLHRAVQPGERSPTPGRAGRSRRPGRSHANTGHTAINLPLAHKPGL